jgi:hypothetical protein
MKNIALLHVVMEDFFFLLNGKYPTKLVSCDHDMRSD